MNFSVSPQTYNLLTRLIHHHLLDEKSSLATQRDLINALEELRLCGQLHHTQRWPLPLQCARRLSQASW